MTQTFHEPLPYLDPDCSLGERVADLLFRLTLDEKISLMKHNTEAIGRLGIPAYNYWGEALHGIARNGRATVFPQAISMAATWEPGLIRRIAGVISDEGRAKFHETLAQIDFVKAPVATGTKVVLVLTGGSAVALGGSRKLVDAVLWAGYPGQEGGKAVADLLFGKVNPSDKLPITFYRSLGQLPPYEDYSMQGRTYRYFAGEPLFPFGFGLSYTAFAYRDITLWHNSLKPGGQVRLEVVQVYATSPEAAPTDPRNTLLAFQRVALEPRESRPLSFTLTAEQLARVNDLGQKELKPGTLRLEVGGCSPGSRGRALGASDPVHALLEVI